MTADLTDDRMSIGDGFTIKSQPGIRQTNDLLRPSRRVAGNQQVDRIDSKEQLKARKICVNCFQTRQMSRQTWQQDINDSRFDGLLVITQSFVHRPYDFELLRGKLYAAVAECCKHPLWR